MAEQMDVDVDTDRLNLGNFPTEVLLQIFSSLNGLHLVNVSQVCKRFQRIAKTAFGKKYDENSENKYFEIRLSGGDGFEDERQRYRECFEIFGKQMTALHINFVGSPSITRNQSIRLFGIIERNCPSVRHIIISGDLSTSYYLIGRLERKLRSLTFKDFSWENSHYICRHYKRLTRFCVKNVDHLERNELRYFLQDNPQLKHLSISNCKHLSINALQNISGKMNELESLELISDRSENLDVNDVFPNKIILKQLNSLSISVNDISFVKVLRAIAKGCKMIRRLEIFKFDANVESSLSNDVIVDVICGFNQLNSLTLHAFHLGNLVQLNLVERLPQLISLRVHDSVVISPDHVLDVFTNSKQLNTFFVHNPVATEMTVNACLSFDMIFHRKFAEIARNGRQNIKFKYSDDNERRILATKAGLYLNGLIETEQYRVSNLSETKDLIDRFGDNIRILNVNMETTDEIEIREIWDLINGNCARKLLNLTMCYPKANVMNALNLSFPRLERLEFIKLDSEGPSIFPSMNCPKLNHLILTKCDIKRQMETLPFGICLDHLTAITINGFYDSTSEVLSKLDDGICDQLKRFEVFDTHTTITWLVYIAGRFCNLIALGFHVGVLDIANSESLFESCTKLRQLSLCYENNDAFWRRMLKYIQENCKDLESLNLYSDNDRWIDGAALNYVYELFPNVELNTFKYNSEVESFQVD